MAARSGSKPGATISLTLPISCQICLGKVKQPVICPNQHVFCTLCMDLWLRKNDQCPTCRTSITSDNPCKPIIGGLNHGENQSSPLSTPNLRKARFDILYQEYEDEIEQLQREIDTLHKENKILQKQVDLIGCDNKSSPGKCKHSGKKVENLMSLTSKLQEATATYEAVKVEMNQLKQTNAKLEMENQHLNMENNKLRQENSSRSPHKYGRYTVAAQQSKLNQYEQEMSQLKRALQRSDDYIEELEEKLKKFECNHPDSVKGEPQKEKPSFGSSKLDRNNRSFNDVSKISLMEESSLNLEAPTPMTPASCFSRLSILKSSENNLVSTPKDNITSLSLDNSRSSSRRKLNFDDSEQPSTHRSVPNGASMTEDSFNFEQPGNISSVSQLDIANTTDFEECARLMTEAESRVAQRRSQSSDQSGIDLPMMSSYPDTQTKLASNITLSLSQLQDTVSWQVRPNSTPSLHVDHLEHPAPDARPSSAPSSKITAPSLFGLRYHCDSYLPPVGNNVWKSSSGIYPITSTTYQQGMYSSTASTFQQGFYQSTSSTSPKEIYPSTSSMSQLYSGTSSTSQQGIYPNTSSTSQQRKYPSTSSSSHHEIYPNMSTQQNQYFNNNNNPFKNLSSISSSQGIRNEHVFDAHQKYSAVSNSMLLNQHRQKLAHSSTNCVSQPLRAIHDDVHSAQAVYDYTGDSRKRKPDLTAMSNQVSAPPGLGSPAKTFRLF
uniref:Uncharacterized serine-rich protein C215.13-like n=1 Tax=Saccoglossus kowalevskii TaxID=10224 RepID=A0ABM0MUP9_SACKO|nr:PREDICTED: uncharacterized serine-rich protein C215.13-like [Saccoglossus kowalevskii]